MRLTTVLRYSVLTATCSLLAACASAPVQSSAGVAQAQVVVVQSATVVPPTASPMPTADMSLAMTQGALSAAMTQTEQAGIASQRTLAAVADAAAITATSVVYRAVETQVEATAQAMRATQTQEPISARETQDARTQGMIDAAATRVAGEADAFAVRQNAKQHEDWRQWIYTGAAGILACVIVGGAYYGFVGLRGVVDAQAEGVKAEDRARARAIEIKAEAEAAKVYAEIERQKENDRLAQRLNAQYAERVSRLEAQTGGTTGRGALAPDITGADVGEYNQRILTFLGRSAELADDGWDSETIPPQSAWGGNGTRSRGIALLKRHGLVEPSEGADGSTPMRGWDSLGDLARAITGRRVSFIPTETEAPHPAGVESLN